MKNTVKIKAARRFQSAAGRGLLQATSKGLVRLACLWLLGLGLVILAQPAWAGQLPTYLPDATYVGSDVCMGCHADQFEKFEKTMMGRIFLKNPRNSLEKLGCEGCHGPGSEHVAAGGGRGVGGIVGYSKDSTYPVAQRNAVCLTCHQGGMRMHWTGSNHESRGLACTDCHAVMERTSVKNQFKKSTELETCFQCHKLKRAQMQRSSHMPLREGKMVCSDCHNPHGSFTEHLLKDASVNETCYTCHADKRGPYLWEHQPVRENCLNCHNPHGSNHAHMLKVSLPRLCQQCHSESGHNYSLYAPGSSRGFNRSCLNCHGQIHGSNAPGGMRFHR
jgi:DmsE family decaheme c-type cytochrome